MKSNNTNNNATVAAGAAVVAASAAATLYYRQSKNNKRANDGDGMTVLVFQDGGEECSDTNGLSPNAVAVKFNPQKDNFTAFKAAVVEALQQQQDIGTTTQSTTSSSQQQLRLFVQFTKEEVTDIDFLVKKALLSPRGGLKVPVLISTFGGSPLSKRAVSGLPLERFPTPASVGVPELPFGYGHLLAFTRGKRELMSFNAYDNLFRNKPEKTLLVKPPLYRKDDEISMQHYHLDYRPYEDEGLVYTTDPQMVSEQLMRQQDFPKMWTSFREQRVLSFTGAGLFTDSTTSKTWETAHGVLPKYFNAIRIKNYYPTVLEKTQVFVSQWCKLGSGALVEDATDWLTCMTSDAVVKAAMDFDMRNVERKGARQELHPFLVAFRACFKHLSSGLNPSEESTREYVKQKQVLADVVNEIVERTRAKEIGGPQSFVTGMLESKATTNGEYIALQDFWGHAINVMVAGHETTAATLGFCLAELARHPECTAKAVAEIERVMQGRTSPTYEDIGNMQYIEACFREALRMYPAVQSLKRECAHDTIVLGKYLLRKGQRIETQTYGLHRNPEQWDQGVFGDPEVFNPDRHLPGAPARHPNAMTPFGFGVRACIGMQFAMLEAKTFLCMILNFFTVQTPPNFEIIPSGKAGAPSCKNLTFKLGFRRGGPMSRLDLFSAPASATESSNQTYVVPAPTEAPPKAKEKTTTTGKPILILYGSNTGTCEDFARLLADEASEEGYESQVMTLDEAVAKSLLPYTTGPVAIVASTYNGTPPDNGTKFSKWLSSSKEDRNKGMHFAVFGVGNSNWEATYQQFPREIHSGLVAAGATQLKDLTTADVSCAGFAEVFEDWATDIVGVIGLDRGSAVLKPAPAAKNRATYIRSILTQLSREEAAHDERMFIEKLRAVHVQYNKDMSAMNKPVPKGTPFAPCQVQIFSQLQSEHSDRSTCHVELSLPEGTSYEAGDHLSIVGCNSDERVNAALEALGMTGEEIVECSPGQTFYARGYPDDMPGVPVTARLALAWLPELSASPTRKDIAHFADSCPCPPEAAELRKLSEEGNYRTKVLNCGLTLTEILNKYKSLNVDVVEFCASHPRVKPRYYSISSSPLVKPNRVSITVGLVEYNTETGHHHKGLASGTVHSLAVGNYMLAKVHKLNGQFKLPADATTPIIMVGPGTGVAPFMGFLEERAVLGENGKELGPAHLFFGCRSSDKDFIYKDTLEGYTKSGVLSTDGLHVAFSREDRQSKVYVQDLIRENSERMWKLINDSAAVVYICGDAKRMAPGVKKAFVDAAAKHGQMTQVAAQNWIGSMISSGRYVEDVYA